MIQVMKTLELFGKCQIIEPGVIEVRDIDRIAIVPKYRLAIGEIEECAPHLLGDTINGAHEEDPTQLLSDLAQNNKNFIENTKPFSHAISMSLLWVLWFYDHLTMDNRQYGSTPVVYSRPRWTKIAHDHEDSDVLTPTDVYDSDCGLDISDTKNLPIYASHRDILTLSCANLAHLKVQRNEEGLSGTTSLDEMFAYGFCLANNMDAILECREIVCHTDGLDIVFRGTVFH